MSFRGVGLAMGVCVSFTFWIKCQVILPYLTVRSLKILVSYMLKNKAKQKTSFCKYQCSTSPLTWLLKSSYSVEIS